ncbi:FAD-binding oxidoreductase [Terrabacter sp. Ter38]|uniref:FAD-binding oxidoreductase n=1 Tax=Terrabacter sp. Ter38 TaxID=2926030 RepID=UPI00211808E4|nr:FAD-binding oxidoreductase [Terrabacter sp. Ter38]
MSAARATESNGAGTTDGRHPIAATREELTGWGRAAPTVAHVAAPSAADDVAGLVVESGSRGVIARGLGRSYGDAAQNAGGMVLRLGGLDRISPVDPITGLVTCGAGVSVDRLIREALPRGWFVPVTPGTRQVSLGGALAADVHGKNHHRDGSISAHVTSLTLVDGRGALRTLTPSEELFWAVPGGMGLTGVVVELTMRLIRAQSSRMQVDTTRTTSLDETMAVLEESDRTSRYTVAWVDCLARGPAMGRGVVTAGDHAPADAAGDATAPSLGRRGMPAPPWVPSGALNPHTVGVFNDAYYLMAPRTPRRSLESVGSFFHPLDVVPGWNRLYGARGFVQHQFAVEDPQCVRRVVSLLSRRRAPTLLCVLKRFGPAGRGPLSFPSSGWTLAVDLPVSDSLGSLLDAMDEVVLASGGRVYLAKDARLRPESLVQMYPRLDEWRFLRDELDPEHVFQSDLARRLHL